MDNNPRNAQQKPQGSTSTNAFIVILKIFAILFGLVILAVIAFFVSCLMM